MLQKYLTLFFIIVTLNTQGQINCQYVNTNNLRIQKAVDFYKEYLTEFDENKTPNYSEYWNKKDCERYKVPDPIAYSISSDYSKYNFGTQKTIFYAKEYQDYVHLKTLFADVDSSKNITVYAITNHYIKFYENSKEMYFISPIEVNKELYTTTQNGYITYHHPKYVKFNKQRSDSLILQIREFEKKWEFKPIKFDYFFTKTQDELGVLRGLDYFIGMEQPTPSGMTFPKDKVIYCNGYDEGYLHEVLHLYLNPHYELSPVNHGLIYYLGGSLGFSFDELINKMKKYPETNLNDFETIKTKDITLNIYNIVIGVICKIIDEKEGVKGLKRLLKYKELNTLFKTEFNLDKKDWGSFIKRNLKKYQTKK
jgi:hypothetical protein